MKTKQARYRVCLEARGDTPYTANDLSIWWSVQSNRFTVRKYSSVISLARAKQVQQYVFEQSLPGGGRFVVYNPECYCLYTKIVKVSK